MRLFTYLNGIEGIAAGETFTARIPVDRRLHGIKIYAAGNNSVPTALTAAEILGNIELTVNSSQMRYLTAAEIIKIAKLNGITPDDSLCPIYFSEPWRSSVTGEEAFSWDLEGQAECVLKGDVSASVASGLSIKVELEYDFEHNYTVDVQTGEKRRILNIMKQLPTSYNAPAGDFDMTTLDSLNLIHRIHIQTSTGAINDVDVYNGSQKIFEATKAQNDYALVDKGIDATQFSFSVVFDRDQQASSYLEPIPNNFLVRPNFASANTARVILEKAVNGYR